MIVKREVRKMASTSLAEMCSRKEKFNFFKNIKMGENSTCRPATVSSMGSDEKVCTILTKINTKLLPEPSTQSVDVPGEEGGISESI